MAGDGSARCGPSGCPPAVHLSPLACGVAPALACGRRSAQCDEAVHHPLAARCLEIDLQLVALDLGDLAIAELLVEYALADRKVAAPLVADADRGRAGFDDAGGRGGEARA